RRRTPICGPDDVNPDATTGLQDSSRSNNEPPRELTFASLWILLIRGGLRWFDFVSQIDRGQWSDQRERMFGASGPGVAETASCGRGFHEKAPPVNRNLLAG
ncbi:MAG: hypothetical protein SX243_26125, partial [Acidobacteriota bacterium]|nr:hypothetical protein [Acidobacteriota bacterium]